MRQVTRRLTMVLFMLVDGPTGGVIRSYCNMFTLAKAGSFTMAAVGYMC